MAGASNFEVVDAFIKETTSGTTPATPAFTKSSFNTLSMRAIPRISESFPRANGGQRGGIGRSGIAVSGSASGNLIYGEYDTFFESLFQAEFSSDVLVNGNSQVSMSVEQSVPAGAGSPTLQYTRFRGIEAASGQIVLTAGQDATVSFDLIGSGSDDADTTALAGATYNDPTVTDVLGSGADIGTITMSGLGTLDCMNTCTIDFQVADKTEQPRISSDDLCGINRGAFRPVINGQFYIEDNFVAIYNAARTGTSFALVIPIGSVSGQKYSLNFPVCEFSEAPGVSAESGPKFQDFTILPQYDTGIGGTCELTRAIA